MERGYQLETGLDFYKSENDISKISFGIGK